jgi:hypothetical protein
MGHNHKLGNVALESGARLKGANPAFGKPIIRLGNPSLEM